MFGVVAHAGGGVQNNLTEFLGQFAFFEIHAGFGIGEVFANQLLDQRFVSQCFADCFSCEGCERCRQEAGLGCGLLRGIFVEFGKLRLVFHAICYLFCDAMQKFSSQLAHLRSAKADGIRLAARIQRHAIMGIARRQIEHVAGL